MKKSMRVRSGFIWVLVGSILISLAAMLFLPEPRVRRQARVTLTRFEERQIASALQQRAVENGGLTNLYDQAMAREVFGTNAYFSERLNPRGEILDYWKTPFQIETVGTTNFIIRSAGPDQKFGGKDDIIFRSASGDFLTP